MENKLLARFVAFVLFLIVPLHTRADNFDAFRKSNTDLGDFLRLVKANPILDSVLTWKRGTLFAPTNQAIREFKYNSQITNYTLLYHYANVPTTLDELMNADSINSELPANPPIWITKKRHDLYLNDAQILRGNLKLIINGQEQVVHVIDRVLEPAIPMDMSESNLDNPTARKFLENSEKYGVGLTRQFSAQVGRTMKNDKSGLLDSIGKRTFFIPVDDAFKNKDNLKSVDLKTIDGHIVDGRAIFLRTAEVGPGAETYKTTDFASNFPVFISFAKEMVGGKEMWLVKSDNREGDKDHLKGVVQAEIVKANIPVKNGVVHLISKPLVIIDTNVYATLRLYANEQIGSMLEFFRLIDEMSPAYGFKELLEGPRDNKHPLAKKITLFVPSNQAIKRSTELDSLRENRTAMAELIKLHILTEAVSVESIAKNEKSIGNLKRPYQVSTVLPDRKLYFNLVGTDANRTVFVEGGGVNATITQPDFGATNGFIHIIDKFLGIPNHNMEEKLRSHPMLTSTYQLWVKERFGERLNDSEAPYTFFAPSEMAWRDLRFKSVGAYDNILQGTGKIPLQLLQRHFLVNQEHSIQKFSELSRHHVGLTVGYARDNSNITDVKVHFPLTSLNGYLRVAENMTIVNPHQKQAGVGVNIKKLEEIQYFVQWRKMSAHVVRANVKCTNGIIHIIDTILMDDEEIVTASAPTLFHVGRISFVSTVFAILVMTSFV